MIDSLKRELKTVQDDKSKAKIFGDLTWYYSSISTDSALVYGEKAMQFAKKLNDSTFLAQTISDNGVVYYLKGEFDTAEKLFKQSLAIRAKIHDSAGIASLNYKIGNIFYKRTLLDSSMVYYLKALGFYERNKVVTVANSLQSNIGAIYMALKNYDKALEYFNKNATFFEDNGQQELLSNTLVNKASVYLYKKDTVQAISCLKKSIETSKQVNAYPTLGSAYNNLGSIYSDKKNYQLAKQYILKSIEIREKANLGTELASSKLTLAGIYSELGDFSKAKPLLLNSLKVFKNENVTDKLLSVYLQLIPIYAYESKPDSVSYYTNLYVKEQALNLQEKMQNVTAELETKYQTEKKESQIMAQRADIAEKELNLNRKNTQLIGLVVLVVVIAIFTFLIYKQQKLKNNQLKKESQLKEALIKIESQNKLQEQRLRISRDLHDNIGAQLTFIISSVENLQYGFKNANEAVVNKLESISAFTKETIFELRDTIWAMNKNEISLDDLGARISNFIERAGLASSSIEFQFNVDEQLSKELSFSSVQGMNIYRIIQEAINNALKYAEAKSIKVQFQKDSDRLKIEIYDDGKGFDYNTVEHGNGLNNMKKRAIDMNAEIHVESKINLGTSVILIV
ncbi:two-component sensor histidine kinase [Yeosuana aromativorans]|uniref:histidine kinase n=1 Tax=Yeosuana aromativorans TaxID=288019 RepID=A0A8J3FGJ8_9FLAO|nr:sensor histidine kinase [Yeosuana aromativorans]GGK10127.1 two-component sensor histidine kinase [Yeosuana aromativorans]